MKIKKGIDVDKNGHVTRVDILSLFYSERKTLHINIERFQVFKHLIHNI